VFQILHSGITVTKHTLKHYSFITMFFEKKRSVALQYQTQTDSSHLTH